LTRQKGDGIDIVCSIKTIGTQLKLTDPGVLKKETAKDPVLNAVMRSIIKGWQCDDSSKCHMEVITDGYTVTDFKKLTPSLSIKTGCLLYGAKLVIPLLLQNQVLQLYIWVTLGYIG